MNSLANDFFTSFIAWRIWLMLGLQDVKSRFGRSILGPVWILVNLLTLVGGIGVVYGLMFGQPMKEFLPSFAGGMVIWGFIASTLIEGGNAFINAEGYIKQFCYPKQIYLFRSQVGISANLLIGFVVLIPVLAFFGDLSWQGMLYSLPGLLILYIVGMGHITFSAYLTTFYRDIPHALSGILQILFFLTPIIFPPSVLEHRGLGFIYQYNPFFCLIEIIRYPLIKGEPPMANLYMISLLYGLLVWLIDIFIIWRNDRRIVYAL